MSGIEVAGIVLGTFPLVLGFLKKCREGFEPLDDWWHFRTKFIEFVDAIEHQKMLYRENMIRLLDPIVADTEILQAMVQDPRDPRWRDGKLDKEMEQRLASERDRFLRTCERMDKVMQELKDLLGVKHDGVRILGISADRTGNAATRGFRHRCALQTTRDIPCNFRASTLIGRYFSSDWLIDWLLGRLHQAEAFRMAPDPPHHRFLEGSA
jgi:hypothetical protein